MGCLGAERRRMLGVYVMAGIVAGIAGAAAGWLLEVPAWVVAALYVAGGSLGLVLAALAVLLAPGREGAARTGSWGGAPRRRPAVEARAAIRVPGS